MWESQSAGDSNINADIAFPYFRNKVRRVGDYD
jgi:hypothetical protein